MIKIEIDDREVREALARLQARVSNMQPAMHDIGELLAERAKQRFETSTAPDGSRWAPNKPSTLLAYLRKTAGNFKKDGGLSKKGAARATGKKPLIGESRRLSGEIFYRAGSDSVIVGATPIYARVQQFGAKKGSLGPRAPWGDIPARPFLPVDEAGRLTSERDKADMLSIIERHLKGAS